MNMMMQDSAQPQEVIARDTPRPDESRAALVQRWLSDVAGAKKHWAPDFRRMRRNMKFAAGKQWPGQKENDARFRVNLIQRVLKASVASLYAKNPTVVFKRRKTLDFAVWDGSTEQAMQAQQTIAMMGALATDPVAAMTPEGRAVLAGAAEAQAIMADIQQGMQRVQMLERIGKTLATLLTYYLEEGGPSFKAQMKQMIRRARTTGVGYVELGFQRAMDLSTAQQSRLRDMAERLAMIERLSADVLDGELDPNSAEAEELKLAIAAVEGEPEQIIREGLVFDFPGSTRIIPSTGTEKLVGWVGADWIAKEIPLTADRIKEVYGKDVGKSFTPYRTTAGSPDGGDMRKWDDHDRGLALVYHVYDKASGLELAVCEGYPDFLMEPSSPAVFIEQFFPFFAITFNDVEDEGRLFPDSDVENLTGIQKEYNRAKEALRQHRIANRPLYVSPKGTFEEEEVKALSEYGAHEVIEVQNWEKGRPVTDLLAPVQKIGVDPNLYETNSLFEDMLRVSGNAEANLGGTAGASATENSIAESSRQGVIGLDGDDFDDMLTALFRAAGAVLLSELSEQTVKGIAGPGAVWPTLSRSEIVNELWLEVEAGSSGRPNADREAARFERTAPILMQVPGITPAYLAKRALEILDPNVNLDEAIAAGLPSIASMNQRLPAPGGGANDPNAQGAHGSDPQTPKPTRDQGQPQYGQDGPN